MQAPVCNSCCCTMGKDGFLWSRRRANQLEEKITRLRREGDVMGTDMPSCLADIQAPGRASHSFTLPAMQHHVHPASGAESDGAMDPAYRRSHRANMDSIMGGHPAGAHVLGNAHAARASGPRPSRRASVVTPLCEMSSERLVQLLRPTEEVSPHACMQHHPSLRKSRTCTPSPLK